jgi:hypothetical protein
VCSHWVCSQPLLLSFLTRSGNRSSDHRVLLLPERVPERAAPPAPDDLGKTRVVPVAVSQEQTDHVFVSLGAEPLVAVVVRLVEVVTQQPPHSTPRLSILGRMRSRPFAQWFTSPAAKAALVVVRERDAHAGVVLVFPIPCRPSGGGRRPSRSSYPAERSVCGPWAALGCQPRRVRWRYRA